MDLGDLNKVWEIKALKKPGEDEARGILERVSKQVQPIMRRRRWRVKLLSEFSHPRLLGLNVGGGVEVKLKLRRFGREWDFLPFEEILDTMLHELCHNEHGPHDAVFYKLWDEIRKECEDLISKGITGTGQGFDAPGRRLGGFTRQPTLPSLRQSAVAAAEKRRRVGALLPSGANRLGGDNDIMVALSPVQAAAMAAERRMQDELWCGSGSHDDPIVLESNLLENVASKRFRESSKALNGVVGNSSIRENGPKNSSPGASYVHLGSTSEDRSSREPLYGDSSTSCMKGSVEDGALWECSTCTLLNKELAPICDACGTQKPKGVGSNFRSWSCKFCTLENNIKLDKCSACGQWRYSHGAPVSTRGPYHGT